jgi:hypothetical protein
MVTEFGDFYAVLLSSLQNARFGRTDDLLAVNGQSDGFQGKGSFALQIARIYLFILTLLSQDTV